MDAEQSRIAILTLLHRQGFATRYEILALREMQAELYEPIREQFLSHNLAIEGPEGGLTYVAQIPFADAFRVLDRILAGEMADRAWPPQREGFSRLSAEDRVFLPFWLVEAGRWDRLETLLSEPAYLEARHAAGEIRDLVDDFARGVAALPAERPQRRILQLLLEVLRRDVDFIARHALLHPQGLFQCLWNSGWWHDCPDAAAHYIPPSEGWPVEGPPGNRQRARLCTLLERWRAERERTEPGFVWVRSRRPPKTPLGNAAAGARREQETRRAGATGSPDGSGSAPRLLPGRVRLSELEIPGKGAELRGHAHDVWCIAYAPDGRRIATGSYDKTVRIWDAESGIQLAVLRGHTGAVKCASFSPDGRQIASGGYDRDRTVRVWDAETGTQRLALRGPKGSFFRVIYSPDGRQIATGASDGAVRFWCAQTGVELAALHGHKRFVHCLSYSPDGRRIASGSDDHSVRVWDLQTGAELAVLRGDGDSVAEMSYSPDGRQIASTSYRSNVYAWDAETFERLEVGENSDDLAAIAAGTAVFAFRASIREKETVIKAADSGREVACFPRRLSNLRTAPSGRDWAGNKDNILYLLHLDGARWFDP